VTNRWPARPEIRAFLDERAARGEPAFWTRDVETNRAAMRDDCARFWGDVEAVAAVDDLSAGCTAAPIGVRRYRPSIEGRLPGLVFFHGGGWVVGGTDTHDGLCRMLANHAGCVVLSVDYRLAPEHPFPAAAADAIAALIWALQHAIELGVDPGRVSVAGDSAGGNLAAVAARRVTRDCFPVASQVLVYPVTGGSTDTASYLADDRAYFVTRDDMLWYFRHYVRNEGDLAHPDLAPLLAADLRGLPPAYVATCDLDPLRDEGRAYAERLRDAGVPVTLDHWPGMIHGFLLMRTVTPAADDLVERVSRFLVDSWASRPVAA
jgi:acetyl esterase